MMCKSKKYTIFINKPLFQAVLINICYFLGNILLFEPYLSGDDNMMSTHCYGVYTGEYGYDLTYINFIYGKLIQKFMKICKWIPWYTVVFYFLIFVSFVLLTCCVLKYFDRTLAWIIVNLFLVFFSYDAYVSIQFTQVAGIIGSIGIFILIFSKTGLIEKIIGCGLFVFSCMIRLQMAKMCLFGAIFFLILEALFFIIFDRKELKNYWKGISRLGVIFAGIIYVTVPRISNGLSEEESEYWKWYWSYNNVRVAVQDYQYPDYQENEEFYQSLGISENDLYLYNSWNADVNTIDISKGSQIIELQNQLGQGWGSDSIETILKVIDLDKIISYFKIFPRSLLDMDISGALICLLLVIILTPYYPKAKKIIWLITPILVILAMNYYMYICNRYLQHRVDVGVCCLGYLLLVFNIRDFKVCFNKKQKIVSLICLLCIWYCGEHHFDSYNYLVDDDLLDNNKSFYEETYKNSDAFYSTVANRSDGAGKSCIFYDAFSVPQCGIGRNIYKGNSAYDHKRLESQGIGDIYMYMVNNSDGYLVMHDGNSDEGYWKCYFDEHTGENCIMVESLDALDEKIYHVYTSAYYDNLSLPEEYEDDSSIVLDIDSNLEGDTLCLDGNVYLKGESGFQQETYLQITDGNTGEQKVYLLTRNEDKSKKKDDAGRYSYVDESIELPGFYSDDDEIAIVVEQDDKYYKWKVDVTHM